MNAEKVLKKINEELELIFYDRSLTPEDRGELGERVILRMANYWASVYGETVIKTSFIYPHGIVLPSRLENEPNPVTEIDLLLITPRRIIPVEIKTIYGHIKFYEDNNMELSQSKNFTGTYDSKNYLRQNEMHCRHLYYHLHKIIPNGNPKYIQPIIVMVGNTTIADERTEEDKIRQPIVTASEFISMLDEFYKPLENSIDMKKVLYKLNKIEVKGKAGKERLLNSQKF